MNFITNTEQLREEVRELRRWLHQHPEPGFEEFETSKFIRDYLSKHEIWFRECTETGVLAEIDTKRDGKTVAFRADIDALPIIEANDVSYKSKNEGYMHACGHDSHTAVLLATAKFIKENIEEYSGKIRFLFQPAEESPPGGAKPMIVDGALEGVDYVYGLHCNPEIEVGQIAVINGPMMAAADRIEIKIIGKGGHGASPHQTIDPVVIASQVINNLQVIVSRNLNPQDAAVVTIGKLEGGFRFNVIAPEVNLDGTVRTLTPETREKVKSRIEEIVKGTVSAHGADYEFKYTYGYPPLINHDEHVDFIREVGSSLLGDKGVIELPFASLGGEDFSYFVEEVPGAFFRLGIKMTDSEQYPLHNAKFDMDEAGLEYGIKMFAGIAYKHNKR
jgi:amidohydrolase